MHNKILTADDLRETSEYIESLSNAPDDSGVSPHAGARAEMAIVQSPQA